MQCSFYIKAISKCISISRIKIFACGSLVYLIGTNRRRWKYDGRAIDETLGKCCLVDDRLLFVQDGRRVREEVGITVRSTLLRVVLLAHRTRVRDLVGRWLPELNLATVVITLDISSSTFLYLLLSVIMKAFCFFFHYTMLVLIRTDVSLRLIPERKRFVIAFIMFFLYLMLCIIKTQIWNIILCIFLLNQQHRCPPSERI